MGAMAKFKVGDRVLVTANEDGEGEGKTAVIIHMCSPYWAHVRFEQPIDGWGKGGQEWGVGVEKLELIADKPTSLQEEVESGRMSVDAARRHLGLDPAPNSTAGYTVPLCALDDGESLFEIKNGKVTFRTQTIQLGNNHPAIVCLIENGQPKPSDLPHVHRNKVAAGKEAERLAKKYPGKRFGVYEYVQHAEVAKPSYKHEWQRLAAGGETVEARKTLQKTGLTGIQASRVVQEFVAVA